MTDEDFDRFRFVNRLISEAQAAGQLPRGDKSDTAAAKRNRFIDKACQHAALPRARYDELWNAMVEEATNKWAEV